MPGLSHTDILIQRALDGLSLRQRVISDNVANVDTPGFKAGRVEFEEAMRSALTRRTEADADLAFSPEVVKRDNRSGRTDGNNVDIETEMILLAETNITYNALAQLSSGRLRLLRHIISEGRR